LNSGLKDRRRRLVIVSDLDMTASFPGQNGRWWMSVKTGQAHTSGPKGRIGPALPIPKLDGATGGLLGHAKVVPPRRDPISWRWRAVGQWTLRR
jgi:hypothetical protein